MDFGATVCTPALPACANCVLQKNCEAFLHQKQQLLPIKEKVLKKKTRYFNYFIIENDENVLLHKRTDKDIWQNLHEYYLSESAESIAWTDFSVQSLLKKQLGISAEVVNRSNTFTQLLTHQTILVNFVLVRTKKISELPPNYFLFPQKEIQQLAFPRVINQYINTPFLQANLF